MPAASPSLFRRLTAGVPLLVTIAVHVALAVIAGVFVVTEQFSEKKKTFEASTLGDSAAVKQVEHRLQVARRGASGGSAASPIPSSRIYSTSENALALPEMTDLPSLGASGMGGFGAMGAGAGLGPGSGMATAMGSGSGLGGRGFMSMTFLGMTDVRARKIVFVVDIGPALLDIRKGGIRAFDLIRQEISKLVAGLSPVGEFNVVFFARDQIRLFSRELRPADTANKNAFFDWVRPINSDLQSLGVASLPPGTPRWTHKPNEQLRLDPDYRPPIWIRALEAALELQPDTVFLITGSAHPGSRQGDIKDAERAREERNKAVAELAKEYDLAAIAAARSKAVAKLRADFDAINKKLIAQKKDPFVIQDIKRVLAPDFQAALKKAGFTLTIDRTGWTDKNGNLMWDTPASGAPLTNPVTAPWTDVEFSQAVGHIARLQAGLLRERAAINLFLFAGPDENTETAEKNLRLAASRNDGRFSLLTAKRLEELNTDAP